MTTTKEQPAAGPTHWRTEPDGNGILWLCLDKADGNANVLSGAVLHELADVLEGVQRNLPRGLVIHSAKRNGFIMGADVNEFTEIENEEQAYSLIRLGQQVIQQLGSLRCPTVAAIDGFALGGGLELALACRYRLVLQNDKPILGLPEVQLGIHPGFGGTVRSVRICGVRAAMQLMLTGKPITPAKAKRQNLIDRIAAPDNWKQAARELIASAPPPARAPLGDRLLNLAPARPFLARMLRKQVAPRARRAHYPAPYAIIDLWERYGASESEGYEAEARSIARLMCGRTSRNLVRVFFLQNRLKSQGGKGASGIGHVHVVGAGVMGGDIAAWCALRGLEVTLEDRGPEYIRPAIDRAAKLFDRRIRDEAEREAAAARLRPDADGDGAAEADLIVEAIFENLEAKQALYGKLQAAMKESAILATNTSSIRLEELRTVLDRPERFVGLHFFNPVASLPLVEVVRCQDTAREVLDAALAFVGRIGKYPLECMSSPGFVVNRILAPYMAEAMELAESGVDLRVIDRAAEDFGMPVGPIELADSVGIDVMLEVSKVLGAAFDKPLPPKIESMVADGNLGKKSGRGFYVWEQGKAVKPEAADAAPASDLKDRLILPMINESVACLHEGVVGDADLLDAGAIFGAGFAPFRGGPLQYARDRGIDDVCAALRQLQEKYGERFRPHEGWSGLAEVLTRPI